MSTLKTFNAEQVLEIAAKRAEGVNWKTLGEMFGADPETVRRTIDPAFRARRAAQIAAAKQHMAVPSYSPRVKVQIAERTAKAKDVAARLAEIPPDTRSLTGWMFGDPLPGRSALDKRSVQNRLNV